MNPGSLVSSAASSTASSAASSAANSAASSAANSAASSASSSVEMPAVKDSTPSSSGSSLDDISSTSSDIPSNSTGDSIETRGGSQDASRSDIGNDTPGDSSSGSQSGDRTPDGSSTDTPDSSSPDSQGNDKDWWDKLEEDLDQIPEEEEGAEEGNSEGLEPGDRVDFGKQIGEDGQVENTNMKKTLDAAAKAAIIIGTEGAGAGAAKAIVDNPASQKLVGVVSDAAEASPALKVTADVLAETGVSDLVNDAADVVSDVTNGDIIGAVKDGVRGLKNLKKAKVKEQQMKMRIIISVSSGILACLFTFLVLFGPTLGGVMWITDKISDIYNAVVETIGSALDPEWLLDEASIQLMLDEIPGYNDLSDDRKAILSTAVLLVGTKYNMGGKPTGPGIEGVPASGLDCSGYVEWVMWTALGTPASNGGTAFFTTPGAPYVRINKEDLLPGDIAVLREGGSNVETGDYNHVGIYAGNDLWFHGAGSATGITRGRSSLSDSTSIFLRRTDIS